MDGYRCFLSDVSDDSDLSTLDLDGDGGKDSAVDALFVGRVDVGRQHREVGGVDEGHQSVDSVVEFVIAQRLRSFTKGVSTIALLDT